MANKIENSLESIKEIPEDFSYQNEV